MWQCTTSNDSELFSRAGCILISHEAIGKILGLPDDIYISHVFTNPVSRSIRVVANSYRFPISCEGAMIPNYEVTYATVMDDSGEYTIPIGIHGPGINGG